MTVSSRRPSLVLTLLLLIGFIGLSMPLTAQDKKKDPDKKADIKKKVDTKKKDDTKKIDKKKDDKKTDPKDIKKEEIKPDLTKEKRDTPLAEFKGHNGWIFSLTTSADGKQLLSASRDRTLKIWDLSSGKEVQTFKDNPTDTRSGVFVAADKIAGSTGKWNKEKKAWEGEIRIWDRSGKQIKSLKGHTHEIECLAVSKDGKLLASGSEDHTIIVWDLAKGKEILTIKAHAGTVHGLAFSPDGKTLASAGEDRTVRIWDLHPGKTPPTPVILQSEVSKLEEAPKIDNNKKKKKGDNKKKMDKKKDEPKEKLDTPLMEVHGPARDFTSLAFSPDGKTLAAGNLEGRLQLWDLVAKKEIADIKTGEGILSVAFSPDGKKVAIGGWDWAIRVYDAKKGKQLNLVHAHQGTVISLSFLPDGKLTSGGTDNLIKVWDLSKIQRTEKK